MHLRPAYVLFALGDKEIGYPRYVEPPVIPGHEFVGEVVELGPGECAVCVCGSVSVPLAFGCVCGVCVCCHSILRVSAVVWRMRVHMIYT